MVEVAHEALLRNWPRLVEWIQKTGEDLAVLRQLRQRGRRVAGPGSPRRSALAAAALEAGRSGARAAADGGSGRAGAVVSGREPRAAHGIGRACSAWASPSSPWRAGLGFSSTPEDRGFKYAVDVLWERVRYTLGVSDLREPEMVQIRPGEDPFPRSFWMGSGDDDREADDDEKPRHEVTFSRPFAIGKYEVTFEEYADFVRRTGATEPSDEGWGRGQAAGDQCVLGGCQRLCPLALVGDRQDLSAADGGGVGVRGAGRDGDAVLVGR